MTLISELGKQTDLTTHPHKGLRAVITSQTAGHEPKRACSRPGRRCAALLRLSVAKQEIFKDGF